MSQRHRRWPSAGGWRRAVLPAQLVVALVFAVIASTSVSAEPPPPTDDGIVPVEQAGGVHHPLFINTSSASKLRALVDAPPDYGRTPAQARSYLQLTGDGAGETVAVVSAYHYPTAAADLTTFSETFGLPAACARPRRDANCVNLKIIQMGRVTKIDEGWSLEAALDIQWLHAMAPRANIILVEAPDDELGSMLMGVRAAINAGATVISSSWGEPEFAGQDAFDRICRGPVLCVFASGNDGSGTAYPAASRHVLAVGGTTAVLDGAGGVERETAWRFSSGGISKFERRPSPQPKLESGQGRGIPDVSFHADPSYGYTIYDSVGYGGVGGWFVVGGTSAATPIWAGIIADANSLRSRDGLPRLTERSVRAHRAIYRTAGTSAMFDVTQGRNGACGKHCEAGPGYDFVTGIGSPRAGIDVALAGRP